jgi:hypothetical protein
MIDSSVEQGEITMDKLRKAGVISGAIVGGVIGGVLSVIGKVSKVKIIDDIGESVVDSTILTGSIAGNIASGTADLVSGAIQKDEVKITEGTHELKDTGTQVVNNFIGNVKLIAGSGGEILSGVKQKNHKKIKSGFKSLIKVASVGFLTVGAIKIKPPDKE